MKDKLILALDVPTCKEARHFVKLLKKEVSLYKVGSVLFTAAGPDVVRMIQDEGGEVFLDLKFHDIPNTVAQACEAAANLGVFMLNVHASGGEEMLNAARVAIKKRKGSPNLLGVTVLTSQKQDEKTSAEVIRLARLCQRSGLDGVVCSPQEIELVRQECGKDFLIVTPGIRLSTDKKDDQKRTATPSEAFRKGADYIVVGRPILSAQDPLKTTQKIYS